MAKKKREPVHKLRAWTGSSVVEVAVWKNGENNYSVTTSRSYKKDDEWQQSDSLFPPDVIALSTLLEQAWLYIQEQDE